MFLYLVLVCTVFAFFVQIWAVRRTSPSRVSLLLGTEPVWAAVVGITIAGDSFEIAGYCGVALVLTGTAWGHSVEKRHRLARREAPAAEGVPSRPEACSSFSGWAHNAPLVTFRILENLERAYGICMDRADPDSSEGFGWRRGPQHIVHVHINM
jgi:hypothetical protein